MPNSYTEAPEVAEVARTLIGDNHPHLANERIDEAAVAAYQAAKSEMIQVP